MLLQDYLEYNGIKKSFFASKLGIDRVTLYRIIKGVMPRKELVRRIHIMTDGQVTGKDLFENSYKHSHKQPS